MSTLTNYPNPCLVAILLVCNTRHGSGAQVLFHYPPHPFSEKTGIYNRNNSDNDSEDDSSSGSDESLTDEDELLATPFASLASAKPYRNSSYSRRPFATRTASNSMHDAEYSNPEPLFGLGEDSLVNLLSPDRTWHKRKFELGINDLTFVGRPVYVRPDGTWARKKRDKAHTRKLDEPTSDTVSASEDDQKVASKDGNGVLGHDNAAQAEKSSLTMFHVVFVMNPPPLEHASRVKDMYDHVVKKFSRALKWEQVHNDYIRKQAELILSVRSSSAAKRLSRSQLSAEIVGKSSLATAITTVYTAIESSRIASVTLSPKVSVSLQIPLITSTAYLPSLTEPPSQPGLWLTTATDLGSSAIDTDGSSTPSASQLAKHYTLLLKAHPQRIVKDALDAGGPLAQHLPKMVAALRPTKSFYKLSAASQISLADIQLLARHLIYWRRAIAITPLHRRDTYIVSPNANLQKLYEASKSYEQQFPQAVPSLPKMLSNLSGVPRPFGVHIPSSDHKETYMLVLAWLMRNGWVTQLRTFAYVRVDAKIKKAVRDAERTIRPRFSNQPTGSENNRDNREFKASLKKRPSLVSQGSSEGRQSVDANQNIRDRKAASLILNPPRASAAESKWLEFIGKSISSPDVADSNLSPEERAEIRKFWPVLNKYFDGHVALETIPIRENLKRKFVWDLLGRLGVSFDGGVEGEDEETGKSIVTLRHW